MWNQCKFYLSQSWKMIKAKKLAYFTLYFANLIGLLLPLMLIYLFSTTYSMHFLSKVVGGERTAVISLREDLIPGLPEGFEQYAALGTYGIEFIYRDTAFSDRRFFIPKIVLVDENYSTFYKLRCTTGTYFSTSQIRDGEYVCVISEDVQQQLFDGENPLGKEVLISSQAYRVIGVLQKDTHFLKVLIPVATAAARVKGGMPEKNVLFRFNEDVDLTQAMTEISSFLKAKKARFTWTWAGIMFQRNMKGLARGMSRNFVISLVLCIFVMMNLGNVMFAVVDAEKKVLGIKYALGISKKKLLIEKTITNCIITLMSLGTLFLVIVIITFGFQIYTLAGEAYKIILLPSFGIVLVLSVVEALLLMRKMFNDRIMNLIQE